MIFTHLKWDKTIPISGIHGKIWLNIGYHVFRFTRYKISKIIKGVFIKKRLLTQFNSSISFRIKSHRNISNRFVNLRH